MKKYMMQWQNMPACLPWEYTFWMEGGDTMAIEYARRHFERDAAMQAGCTALLLWANPHGDDERLVAEIRLEPPQARVTIIPRSARNEQESL